MATTHASAGSTVYARALAEAVEAAGGLDALQDVGDALEAFGEAWEADRVLRSYFLSSEVPRAQRRAAMDRLVEQRVPRLLGNFLRLLLERGRLTLLPEIAAAYRGILDERLGRVPVTITTAVPVPDAELRRWKETIRAAIGRDAVVHHHVKPEIIAGAVIRVGDRVADGSARRRLAELHTRIIERGTHRHALQS
jgi:F-type H+-transporting ATPase subunit delta